MSNKKTAVIMLGAGAPLTWKGPSTKQITDRLFQSTEFQTKDGKNLALYIRDCLADYHECDPSIIHFEYIINALETLCDYLHEEAGKENPPQFTGSRPLWLTLSEIFKKIENFEFIPSTNDDGFLKNSAAKGTSPVGQKQKTYKYAYLSHAIDHYLMIIRNLINYDYKDAVKKYDQENKELISFYKALKEKGYVVRFYTTNYDNLVPNIFELHGVANLYRGFREADKNYEIPDINTILTKSDIDCYYNLHGSIYWQSGTNEFFEPSFCYTGFPSSAPIAHVEYTNPSESTTMYNIITGFNKLQKVSVEPLKSFLTALSNDTIKADLIATVGYSYGDNHINRSLAYGVKYGKAKFLHVTKSENFFGSTEFIYMQEHTMKKQSHLNCEYDGPWIWSKDKRAAVYKDTFTNFLVKQHWTKLFDWIH